MKTLDILILLIIAYVFYLFKNKHKNKKKTNHFANTHYNNKLANTRKSNLDDTYLDDLVSEIDEWDRRHSYGIVEAPQINKNFLDIKFHDHYRDVLTAINNLVPTQKQLFNLANQPIKYSEINPSEVYGMVTDLIGSLNKNICSQVPPHRNNNSGWDEALPDPVHSSGWEKVQQSLGLAPSLYPRPAAPGKIVLLKIDKVKRYESEDEIKYDCFLLLQKEGIDDQMVLRASLVQDKRSIHDENDFFKSHDIVMRVAIEELYIIGFLSNKGMDANAQYDNMKKQYYAVADTETNDITDPKYIMAELNKRHAIKSREMNYRNSLLDTEGLDFHRQKSKSPYDYPAYQSVRTIYDDFTKPKVFE